MQYHNYIVKPGTELAGKLEAIIGERRAARDKATAMLKPHGIKEYKMGRRLISATFGNGKIDSSVWKYSASKGGYVPARSAPKELREFWKNHTAPSNDDLERAVVGSSIEFIDFETLVHASMIAGTCAGQLILRVPAMKGKWKPNPQDVEEITISRLQELIDQDKEGGSN
jgi:hypothetical protein